MAENDKKEKGKELVVEPYTEIEDARNGETIYSQLESKAKRSFWFRAGSMPQFPYVLNYGVSVWHHFLPVGIIVERKKVYGDLKCSYRLIRGRSGESQEIKIWVYDDLFYMDGDQLEWNNFFVVEDNFILEFQAYTGKNAGNTIMTFYFHDQEGADKFVLPEWGKSYIREVTGDLNFREATLARNSFPLERGVREEVFYDCNARG